MLLFECADGLLNIEQIISVGPSYMRQRSHLARMCMLPSDRTVEVFGPDLGRLHDLLDEKRTFLKHGAGFINIEKIVFVHMTEGGEVEVGLTDGRRVNIGGGEDADHSLVILRRFVWR